MRDRELKDLYKRYRFIESCLRYETGEEKAELLREKEYILKAINRIKKIGRL